jgi:hypothetical protein
MIAQPVCLSTAGVTDVHQIATTVPTCSSLGIADGTPCSQHGDVCLITPPYQCTVNATTGAQIWAQPATYLICASPTDPWNCAALQ